MLCAPTAFGKTVTAAAMIARRGVNTLVLVHRTELLKQWQERLQAFLGVGKGVVGTIGGGKAKPTGRIDIAVMQSLSPPGRGQRAGRELRADRRGRVPPLSAVSFDAILKRAKAKYVLGLTATPIRRDGQQPIIFMQCGPIRHTAAKPAGAPHDLGGDRRDTCHRDRPAWPTPAFRTCSGTAGDDGAHGQPSPRKSPPPSRKAARCWC